MAEEDKNKEELDLLNLGEETPSEEELLKDILSEVEESEEPKEIPEVQDIEIPSEILEEEKKEETPPPEHLPEVTTEEPKKEKLPAEKPKEEDKELAKYQKIMEKLKLSSPDQVKNIGLLLDVYLTVTVELGRKNLLIKDVLSLGEGSIIELDKPAKEPVNLLVNNRLIARGEVVVMEEHFGVRITEVVSLQERLIHEARSRIT